MQTAAATGKAVEHSECELRCFAQRTKRLLIVVGRADKSIQQPDYWVLTLMHVAAYTHYEHNAFMP